MTTRTMTRARALLLLFFASLVVMGACHDGSRSRSPKRARKQCFEDSECKHSRHCYKPAPDQWGFCDPGDGMGAPPSEPPPALLPPDGDAAAPAPTIQPQPGDIQI